MSDQEREARYICESFKAFTGVRVLLGAFSVLLAPFWTLLGAFFDALGCLLGALGRLFGASWVLLGRLLGPLDTILQFQSEFCSIWACQRLPKGSQEGAKIDPKSIHNRIQNLRAKKWPLEANLGRSEVDLGSFWHPSRKPKS